MRKLKLREAVGRFTPKSVPQKARSLPTAQGEAQEVLRDLRESHTEGSGLSTHDDGLISPSQQYHEDGTELSPSYGNHCTERLSDLSKVIQLTNCQSSEPFCCEPFSLLSCLVTPKSQLPQQQSPGMCNGGGDVGLNSI